MPEKEEDIKLSDELKDSLRDIVKSCEKEDDEIYKAMKRQWRKSEEFWDLNQYLFWDASNETWRSAENADLDDEETEDQIGSFSDKVVDIYKAHGESIISALAAQIPGIRFMPDDADSNADVLTARTYSKISELIQKHNKVKLFALKALFYLANHGVVASYRYKESDFAYGSMKVPSFGEQDIENVTYTCEDCGYQDNVDWTGGQNSKKNQQPFEYDNTESKPCPQCGSVDKPKKNKEKIKVPIQTGTEDKPKTRIKIDIFGALHFKVSYYARNQKECTYLGLFMDQGKDVVCSLYPDLYDDIQSEQMQDMDRFARSAYVYPSEQEIDHKNIVTVSRWWLRPAAFYRETEKHKRDALLKKFPDGCKVTFIGKNKIFAAVEKDKFDDRWEIGQAGLSTYIYSGAILKPLIQIQEMRNQLVNLIIETIEHGIPSEFADPKVVNFDTYNRFEAVPGYIYQTKSGRPGEPIGNSFYTSQRATLSREVALFLKQLDQDAQFSVGSFPSIYGGPSEGKSRTFAEYAASRQMALQRLSIVWALWVDFFVRTLAGSVQMYTEVIVEDEKFSKFEDGNYINVWIKKSQMEGKIGGVEPEGAEGFPVSIAQKKDLILKLMEMHNEYIDNALYKPASAKVIQDVMGLTELEIPGEKQRIKQVIEINELLKSEPIPTGEAGPDGQEILLSSVQVDPNVDDDAVHIETLISFMVDLPGLDILRERPEAYANLTAHLKMHQQNLAMKTASLAGNTPAGEQPETAHAGVE